MQVGLWGSLVILLSALRPVVMGLVLELIGLVSVNCITEKLDWIFGGNTEEEEKEEEDEEEEEEEEEEEQ